MSDTAGPPPVFIHPQGLCESDRVGSGTRVWASEHRVLGAAVGDTCASCLWCQAESEAVIGERVTAKDHVLIIEEVAIADDVFICPGPVFTDDLRPARRGVAKRRPTISASRSVAGGFRIDVNTASPEGLTEVCRVSEESPTKGRVRHRVPGPRHRTVVKIGAVAPTRNPWPAEDGTRDTTDLPMTSSRAASDKSSFNSRYFNQVARPFDTKSSRAIRPDQLHSTFGPTGFITLFLDSPASYAGRN